MQQDPSTRAHPVGANTYSWMWALPLQPCLQRLASPVAGMRQFTVDCLKGVIALAADLGCPNVIVVGAPSH